MATARLRLDDLRVASPCPASWDSMVGTERVRYCTSCRLNVYNLSAMRHEDAEELIRQTEGRLCVRFFQRTDGRIMTTDCPLGVRAVWVLRLFAALAFGFVLLVFGLRPAPYLDRRNDSWLTRTEPFRTILNWINPPRTPPPNPPCVMGKLAK